MTPHDLVGRRVRVLSWEDLRDVLPAGPSGTVTQATDSGAGGVELTVQIAGLDRSYAFRLDEVEVLASPQPSGEPGVVGSA